VIRPSFFAAGAAVASALVAACFDPVFRDSTCGPKRECPDGMTCAGGPGDACVLPGGPIDAAVDDADLDAPVDAGAADATGDGRPDAVDDAGVDAAPPDAGPPCDDTMPFREPVLVRGAVNTAADERGASLSPDERTLYFSRAVPGQGFDLFVATRADRSAEFGAATALGLLNTVADETRPTLAPDGASLVFASSGRGQGDLYFSYRGTAGGDFPAPQPFAALNDPDRSDADPHYASDYETYWVRDGVLFYSRKPFGPGPVDGILPQQNNRAPVLSANRLLLYFSHDDGFGPQIWMARRYRLGDPYGQSEVQLDVSWPNADDDPEWMSADQCRLYLSSNRPGGAGFDLWVADRTPL
jgi:hypothetical protein